MGDFLINKDKENDFKQWAKLKMKIHFFRDETKLYFNIREIWWASLGVNIGQEQNGKNDKYERPVLILRKFNQRIILVISLSSRLKQGRYYYHFFFNGRPNVAILSQVRLLSVKRLIRKAGSLDNKNFRNILSKLKTLF